MTAIKHSGAVLSSATARSVRRTQLRRSNKSIAIAVRQYWTSRCQSGSISSAYRSFREYAQRPLPRYDGHASTLHHNYVAGIYNGKTHPRRNVSSWGPDDESETQSRRHRGRGSRDSQERFTNSHHNQHPWETRTRLAGERYLRLMEDHMKLLRRDPYWGLFGASELRGVWNPWRKYYEVHQRTAESINTSKSIKADVLCPNDRDPSATAKSIAQTAATEYSEYRFDPITNRNVLRTTDDEKDDENPGVAVRVKVHTDKASATNGPVGGSIILKNESSSMSKKPELTGFARQPWLIHEGFVAPLQKLTHVSNDLTPSPWDKMRNKNLKQQLKRSKAIVSPKGKESDILLRPPESSNSSRAVDTLLSVNNSSIENPMTLQYDEGPDTREDLDLLRPNDIRASSGKVLKGLQPSPLSREQRWQSINTVAINMFRDRELRLNEEFAASRWKAIRGWNAYPGEIPQTSSEQADRRKILERSFDSSLAKFEMDMMKLLGIIDTNGAVSVPKQTAEYSIHSTNSMRNVAKYIQNLRDQINHQRTRLRNEQKMHQQQADAALQKEIAHQKSAMAMHESRSRLGPAQDALAVRTNRNSDKPQLKSKATDDEKDLIKEIQTLYRSSQKSVKHPLEAGKVGKDTTSEVEPSSPISGENIATSIPSKQQGELTVGNELLEASVRDFETIMKTPPIGAASVSPSLDESIKKASLESVSHNSESQLLSKPRTYLLLAYDKANKRMRLVRTTSSKYEEKSVRRTIDSILSRLESPAQYFDFIEKLEKAGYELVAGSRKMLVYKDTLNRDAGTAFNLDDFPTSTRGWGAPNSAQNEVAKPRPAESSGDGKTKDMKITRKPCDPLFPRVRRMEDKFSGPGPRFSEPPPFENEQIDKQERPKTKYRQIIWRTIFILGLVYGFGVFMEWSKERDRAQLTKEYQQEVKRVREFERKRAEQWQARNSSWSF